MKLHVNWGHASTQQMKRVLADSEGGNLHLVASANEELAQREVCQAFDRAPHVPAAGTSIVAMLSEKLLADLLFLGDIIALRLMDVFSKYSFLIPVRARNPQEVWAAIGSSRIGVFGPPTSIHIDGGGD